ncbi:RNA-binding S4 domain-containing protein [Aliishimia ponticola]|uniref:RNA-binding S4 domain-containing protein n=1 Tax=Aliishimia ponticola TaxID=2499833 RepID=A0A4S4NBC4_9RHOB|nr:RNA-binding S4 domain-containing protein [Aliishimia ponticola]THH35975.1 RNA-binding S4 domain-containing protein [Aliishimia ponticola]
MTAPPEKLRIDKWLWQARFFKTRSVAAAQVSAGHVRVNATKIHKPAQNVAPGDVLTFPQGRTVRVIRVEAIGQRRGPAPEAQALYTDLDPPQPRKKTDMPENPSYEGKGRPTGRDRRRLDLSRSGNLE